MAFKRFHKVFEGTVFVVTWKQLRLNTVVEELVNESLWTNEFKNLLDHELGSQLNSQFENLSVPLTDFFISILVFCLHSKLTYSIPYLDQFYLDNVFLTQPARACQWLPVIRSKNYSTCYYLAQAARFFGLDTLGIVNHNE